ncbi:MAG: CCA tRNA nucleotidyltransferase, partial [Candidatus Binatia bacterium]
LTRIDALGSNGDLTHYQYCMDRLAELPAELMRPPRLLTGRDLIDLGLAPGSEFRHLLELVEDAQLEERISSREEAVELVRRASERLQVGE